MSTQISHLLTVASASIDTLDAELLLAHTLGTSREHLLAHVNDSVGFFRCRKFLSLVAKRRKGIPLAYLTGHKEFFGLDFLVNRHTLIPRPDTEVLVEAVIDRLRTGSDTLLIDIGTGSGCIPISIMKIMQQQNNVSLSTIATDISRPALRIAKKNAALHKTPITFLHGNLLEPAMNLSPKTYHLKPIILTANLPYLTSEQFASEPSIQHEPHSALVADDHGLACYKKLLKQVSCLISSFQFLISVTCFLEIDPSQTTSLTSHIHTLFPTSHVEIKKDLCGRDRVIICTIASVTQEPFSSLYKV